MCPAEHIHTLKAPSSLLMAEAISRSKAFCLNDPKNASSA